MDGIVEQDIALLLEAAKNGDAEAVGTLLEKGVYPNCINDSTIRKTPLMAATLYNHLDVLELLLEGGAKVEQRNCDGLTALHWAASKGFHLAIDLMLRSQPEAVNVTDVKGRTPLHSACYEGRIKCVETLLRSSHCDVNIRDKHDKCASYYICRSEEVRNEQDLCKGISDLLPPPTHIPTRTRSLPVVRYQTHSYVDGQQVVSSNPPSCVPLERDQSEEGFNVAQDKNRPKRRADVSLALGHSISCPGEHASSASGRTNVETGAVSGGSYSAGFDPNHACRGQGCSAHGVVGAAARDPTARSSQSTTACSTPLQRDESKNSCSCDAGRKRCSAHGLVAGTSHTLDRIEEHGLGSKPVQRDQSKCSCRCDLGTPNRCSAHFTVNQVDPAPVGTPGCPDYANNEEAGLFSLPDLGYSSLDSPGPDVQMKSGVPLQREISKNSCTCCVEACNRCSVHSLGHPPFIAQSVSSSAVPRQSTEYQTDVDLEKSRRSSVPTGSVAVESPKMDRQGRLTSLKKLHGKAVDSQEEGETSVKEVPESPDTCLKSGPL